MDRHAWRARLGEQLGLEPQTLFTSMLAFIHERREQAWSEMVGQAELRSLRSSRRSVRLVLHRRTAESSSCGSRKSEAEVGSRKPEVGSRRSARRSEVDVGDEARSATTEADTAELSTSRRTRQGFRRAACSSGRSRRTTSSRRWTARSRCPAGATSSRSRSSTGSTCWPPACGR